MNGFTVWYILTVIVANGSGVTSMMGVNKTLPECEANATRQMAVYPAGTAKWACHEMNIQVTGDNIEVRFPNL